MTINKTEVVVKTTSKCKYYREAENQAYIPSCGVKNGVVENDVHPANVMDWVYCPYCGGKIKLKNRKRHPSLFYSSDGGF